MWIIALYFGCVIFGILVGSKFIPKGNEIKHTDKLFPCLVFFVIFLMGIRIGSDEKVISSIGSIGFASFVLAMAAMAGSVTAVTLLRKLLKIDRKGIRQNE